MTIETVNNLVRLCTDNLTRTTKRQNTQNNTTQKVAVVNSTIDTLRKKPMLRDRTDRAWFSRFSRHLAMRETQRVYSFNPAARTGPVFWSMTLPSPGIDVRESSGGSTGGGEGGAKNS